MVLEVGHWGNDKYRPLVMAKFFPGQSEVITIENYMAFGVKTCSNPKWKESQLPLKRLSPETQFPSLP